MSTIDLTAAIRDRLHSIGTAATSAAEALDGNALDLPEGTLAGILAELQNLEGWVELAACTLADALDPIGCGRRLSRLRGGWSSKSYPGGAENHFQPKPRIFSGGATFPRQGGKSARAVST
jgi:hypothetical protein